MSYTEKIRELEQLVAEHIVKKATCEWLSAGLEFKEKEAGTEEKWPATPNFKNSDDAVGDYVEIICWDVSEDPVNIQLNKDNIIFMCSCTERRNKIKIQIERAKCRPYHEFFDSWEEGTKWIEKVLKGISAEIETK